MWEGAEAPSFEIHTVLNPAIFMSPVEGMRCLEASLTAFIEGSATRQA